MIKTFPGVLAIAAFSFLFTAPGAKAQCSDAWINSGIPLIMGHAPFGSGISGECNKMLYGQGSWSSYQDLLNKIAATNSVRLVNGVGGKCLDVTGGGLVNNTKIIGWGCYAEAAQFFLYRPGTRQIRD